MATDDHDGRRSPDPHRPGTVYRSRPRLLRLGQGGGLGRLGRRSPAAPPEPDRDPDGYQDAYQAGYPADYRDAYPPPPPGQGYPPPPPGQGHGPGYYGADGYGQGYPPPGVPTAPETAYPPGPPPRRRRRRRWPIVTGVLLLLIGYPALLAVSAVSSLNRVNAFPSSGRPKDTPGRTYLLVGSDSREDLSRAERARLGTGQAAGQRTDTIMILHVPSGGGPTVLISLPRDSYVSIPGHGKNKINAAFAFGGPQLLVRTVEQATGLRIDEYVETGLGGYANLVDAIGGVRVCVAKAMNDPKAHINLKAGCQQMDGKTALGYARARYSDPARGDLGRVERQRQVLAAIASKTLSPAVLALPWRAFPAARAGGHALTVDEHTSSLAIAQFVRGMRAASGKDGLSLTVPVARADLSTPAGIAVQWKQDQAAALFRAIAADDTSAVRPFAAAQKKG